LNLSAEEDRPLIVACIPAFNEERSIGGVVVRTLKHVDRVIVCDDGSVDFTGEIAESMGATVVRHERNLGYGAAIARLFEEALRLGADVVVTLDGDGQHDPTEIPRLGEGDVDIVRAGIRVITGLASNGRSARDRSPKRIKMRIQ